MEHQTLTIEERRARRELRRRQVRRRRRVAGAVLLAIFAVPIGVGGIVSGGDESEPARSETGATAAETAKPIAPPELPRGGRSIFPEHRVVAFYGAPQSPRLGILGIGPLSKVGAKLRKQSGPYRRAGRPLLPAFELIATIANGHAGSDGKYRTRQKPAVIDRHLREARRQKALLLLDVQPGREDFMREARALERWLSQPDVSLALDPEWSMGPNEVPGVVIGSTTAAKVNEVSAYLSRIVRRGRLPDKLLVVHMFTNDMIENKERLRRRPGVEIVLNVDGFGTEAQKVAKYREFTKRPRPPVHWGFKLFYEEDTGLMRPSRVLRMRPRPELVIYE